MTSVRRLAPLLFVSLLGAGCSTMYGASLSVSRYEPAPSFTQHEQDQARAIVAEIGEAARFWRMDPLPTLADPSSYEYLAFIRMSGRGSEQDTVWISGSMRRDRREIVISVGDPDRGEPLPQTQQLVDDLRAALGQAFPESRVEVKTRNTPRIFGP